MHCLASVYLIFRSEIRKNKKIEPTIFMKNIGLIPIWNKRFLKGTIGAFRRLDNVFQRLQ